jgi:hypothetical protein
VLQAVPFLADRALRLANPIARGLTAANYSFVDRAELLAEIDAGWRELDELVAGLAEDDWLRMLPPEDPDADIRTVADVVAHIAAWKQNAMKIAMAQAAADAEPVDGYPNQVLGFDFNAFNHDVLLEWRGQPSLSVLARHRAAHHGLVAALEPLPDERLLVEDRPRRWLRPALGHLGDHLEELHTAVGSAS